jgi:N-acetylmuramoyl-L-alanine amidase
MTVSAARTGLIVALPILLAASASAAPIWPAAGTELRETPLSSKPPRSPWRIYLDAGHGAPGNTGNQSVTCEDEENYTLRTAKLVAEDLTATKRFRVKLSRETLLDHPDYPSRITEAEKLRSAVIVSIHSDSRGAASPWNPRPDVTCLRNDAEPGIGVLISDEGPKRLVAARKRLARTIARRLTAAGFLLYGGDDWMTLYARDTEPGVFIDRRPLHKRVYFLRKPRIPSVIVETHHSLDFEEAARWDEPRTVHAFSEALAAALDEVLRQN